MSYALEAAHKKALLINSATPKIFYSIVEYNPSFLDWAPYLSNSWAIGKIDVA